MSTSTRGRLAALLLLVLALVAGACGGDEGPDPSTATEGADASVGNPVSEGDEEPDTTEQGATETTPTATESGSADDGTGMQDELEQVVVGSTNFDEQELVAEMYALSLEDAGFTVDRRYQLGSREVVLPALTSGEIDVYPEYVGTALEFLNDGAGEATGDTEESLELLRGYFAEQGIDVLEPADAEDKNGLVVTQETAEQHGLETVSDLADVAGELTLGGPPECPERPLCIPGYEEVYGITFGDFRSLDAGGPVTIEALDAGEIDVALLFTTDGVIAANDWVLLEDDQALQPAENIVPVVRQEVSRQEVTDALNEVSAVLTTENVTEMIRQLRVDLADPAEVAEAFLTEEGVLG